MARNNGKNNGSAANIGFEEKLWAAADKMRGHMDPGEYKHVALAAIVLAVHWLARRRLFLISKNPGEASRRGLRLWWWDFLFYTTFGVMVTSSVRIAGVLLVFSLLTMPAVTAMLCRVKKTSARVIFGWIFGAVGCMAGLEASLRADLAAGPSIITTLLGLLLVCATLTWAGKHTALYFKKVYSI